MFRRLGKLLILMLMPTIVATASAQIVLPNGEIPSLAPLIESVSPAVVNISTSGTVEVQTNPLLNDPFFQRFFDMPQPRQQRQVQSLGSGVIVNADHGFILTNHHVIANANQITVGLDDGRELEAIVIGSDAETDLAVIQVEAETLAALNFADSDELRVGDYTIAIGNPFGLGHTVTTGVVSGLERSLPGSGGARLQRFIQTDASINPGNSGGALINLRGELIGINTAILSRGGGNIGIGFAIPINMAAEVMDQLIEYGAVRRGVLGIRSQNLTPEIAAAFGVERLDGALVAHVAPDSAAQAAGLEPGDIIVAVKGRRIRDATAMANAVGLLRVDETVEVVIIRDGLQKSLSLTIGDPQAGEISAGALHPLLSGARFNELDERSPLFGAIRGVLVTAVEPRTRAAQYLQPGDVITSVNRAPVDSIDLLKDQLAAADMELLLNIQRGERAFFVLLR